MTSLLTGWLLALALGARHASEPDHVVALSTLLAATPNARRAAWLGAFWGIGHSITLLLAGVGLMWLHLSLSVRAAALFELAVAAMLLFLGARCLVRAVSLGRRASPRHARASALRCYRAVEPANLHVVARWPRPSNTQPHRHVSPFTLARRPLLVGLVHGLAGSGALSALALASMPSFASAVIFMVCFGMGSVLGMMALSGLAGWPLARLGRRARAQAWLFAFAGVSSLVLGVVWGWPLLGQITGS